MEFCEAEMSHVITTVYAILIGIVLSLYHFVNSLDSESIINFILQIK